MRLKTSFLFLLSSVSVITAAEAPLLFRGLLQVDHVTRVGVSLPQAEQTQWFEVGDSCQGFKIEKVDVAQRTLTVSKDGVSTVVPFLGDEIVGPQNKAGVEDAMKVVDQLRVEELVKKSIDQQRAAFEKMSNSMVSRMGVSASPEELAAYQEKVVKILSSALPADSLKKDIVGIYEELYSKEQLSVLGDFFGTPAGKAWMEKQLQFSQKFQELTLPRMRAVGVQLQTAAAEFAQQLRAKHPAPIAVVNGTPILAGADAAKVPVVISQGVVTPVPPAVSAPAATPSVTPSSTSEAQGPVAPLPKS